MGQAKQRGTFEQRKLQGEIKQREAERMRSVAAEKREAELTPAQRSARRKGKYSGYRTVLRNEIEKALRRGLIHYKPISVRNSFTLARNGSPNSGLIPPASSSILSKIAF